MCDRHFIFSSEIPKVGRLSGFHFAPGSDLKKAARGSKFESMRALSDNIDCDLWQTCTRRFVLDTFFGTHTSAGRLLRRGEEAE